MATDVTNSVEDAEMAECEEDKVVTMMDVLQEQEDCEEDANAVLGASDDKNCTYSKGYIKRQALYACMTCCSEAKSDPTKRAGLCLACSLICHENHELVELYTKRNFRCDCGNSKFTSHPCQLTPNKALLNEENSYNQNFSGLYCVCHRPYPDPENTVEDEMIQCTICEDWLHASHLETTVPASDKYTEMICKGCMENNVFLCSYSSLMVNVDNTNVDIININENENKCSNICNGNVKIDKTDVKTEGSVQSQESEDIDMSEKVSNCITEDKIESSQNILNESETNTHDLEDNKDSTSSEKETHNAKGSNDSQRTSDDTEKVVDKMPESEDIENLQDINKESLKTENIKETDESHSDNISEQYTSDEQPKEIIEGNSDRESKKIVDNKTSDNVTPQENDTNQDTIVTVGSPKIETENANSNIETNVSNQNKADEERMEEDRLLADPSEDIDSKSNLGDEKSDDSKTNHNMENTSSDGKIADNLISNSEQDVENPTSAFPKMDQEESTKLENEVSQDPVSPKKAINSGAQKVENKELSEENKSNNAESESPIDNNLKATVNNEVVQEKSDNTEQSTSNSCKESKTNSQDKATEKRKLATDESSSNDVLIKKTKLEVLNNDIKICICPKNVTKIVKGATFWPSSLRQKLCTCGECLTLYKDLSVLYLIDPEDTVTAYTNLGIEKTNGKPSQYEEGLQALSSLDRIQQINALTEYNKMRDKLLDFLKSFKDRKEIVKEEDIKTFFAGMKPTREPDGVYFCR